MGMDVALSFSAAGAALLSGTTKYAEGRREQEMAEMVLLPGRTGPQQRGGVPTLWFLLRQTPPSLLQNGKSLLERLQHLISETPNTNFTFLLIFSNQQKNERLEPESFI